MRFQRIICPQSSPEWSEKRGAYRWTSTKVRDALGLAYAPDDSINGEIRLALGRAAEDAILQTWYSRAQSLGYTDLQPAALIEHPGNWQWATTTDGLVWHQDKLIILEVKNRANGKRYTEPGVNDLAERVQCLWHLACVPEAYACARLAWTGFDLIEDMLVRNEVQQEIIGLEDRVLALDSDEPDIKWGAMLATEQALLAVRNSREVWESLPHEADGAVERYLTAKQAKKFAEEDLRRAEQALVLATGNQEYTHTPAYFIKRTFRVDGVRGPFQITKKVDHE